MSAPDTTSPGPSLLASIFIFIGTAIAAGVVWICGLVLVTWFIRLIVTVVAWAWHVWPW